jgi:hypothetical protein
VLGDTIDPVNDIDGNGSSNDVADVNFGPLSVNGTASTNCTSTVNPVSVTCTSDVGGLVFALDGETLITADALHAESTSTNDGTPHSDSDGTGFTDLCIVESAGAACTPITAPGSYNIAGACDGSIDVAGEDASSSEGGSAGSGLTVTMLHVGCDMTGGAIDVNVGQAHTFVAGSNPPPQAPTATPAGLPNSGGLPGGDGNGMLWLGLAGMLAGLVVGLTSLHSGRKQR